MKNNKITTETVLVGFGHYDLNLFKKYSKKLNDLDFDESLDLLKKENIRFALFDKNNTKKDLENYAEDYPYLIWFCNEK